MKFKFFGRHYNFRGFKNPFYTLTNPSEMTLDVNVEDFSGLKLRVFSSKNNKYIGAQLPVSGYCVKKIQVETDKHWYVFKTVKLLQLPGYSPEFFIIKPKEKSAGLNEDKVAVYFMLVAAPEKLRQNAILMKDLRYTGEVYTRPIIN